MVRSRAYFYLVFGVLGGMVANCHAYTVGYAYRTSSNGAGVAGLASATVTNGPYSMTVAAAPSDGKFFVGANGMGVNSNGIADVADMESDKINIPGGTAPGISGSPEAITFSFSHDGLIRDIQFDGVKDENLEYAKLTLPNGSVMTFMDAEAPHRLEIQGFSLVDIHLPDIRLLVNGNDDLNGVHIPVLAGQVFTLSYGEYPYPVRSGPSGPIHYTPTDPQLPNGYRLEGLTVVPEPATILLCLAAALSTPRRRR